MTLNNVNSAIYLTATLGNLFHIELLNYLALLPCGIAAYFLIRERSAIKITFHHSYDSLRHSFDSFYN